MFARGAILLVCLCLAACDSGEDPQKEEGASISAPRSADENASGSEAQDVVRENDKVPSASVEYRAFPQDSLPLDPDMRAKADKILDFANKAQTILQSGYYAMPGRLRELTGQYLSTWKLPAHTKIENPQAARQSLKPPQGLFDEKEERALTEALKGMDRYAAALIEHFRSLEKYVADDSIRDNGKKGRELAKGISVQHGNFMAARKSWLETVNARAAQAEELLLRGHPLQRQILRAGQMFAQMREIGELASANAANAATVEPIRKNLAQLLVEAEAPPFPAAPALERLYRAFLKQVHAYNAILDRALREGFFDVQKRELNEGLIRCQKSYNAFAQAANQAQGR